jgi:ribulose-bisphosphate carboxylase large chain
MLSRKHLELSGERFTVTYRIYADSAEAHSIALGICLEQTVEFPGELVPKARSGPYRRRLERFEAWDEGVFRAEISYASECTSANLRSFSTLFSETPAQAGYGWNSSRSASFLKSFRAAFRKRRLRKLLGVPQRPIFHALKPMGLSADELADLAYRFALGGIDVIKDDHGLSTNAFPPLRKGDTLLGSGAKSQQETGYRCLYMPNIASPFGEIINRRDSRRCRRRGLMLSPALPALTRCGSGGG